MWPSWRLWWGGIYTIHHSHRWKSRLTNYIASNLRTYVPMSNIFVKSPKESLSCWHSVWQINIFSMAVFTNNHSWLKNHQFLSSIVCTFAPITPSYHSHCPRALPFPQDYLNNILPPAPFQGTHPILLRIHLLFPAATSTFLLSVSLSSSSYSPHWKHHPITTAHSKNFSIPTTKKTGEKNAIYQDRYLQY